jgi:hypothetical protein
MTTTFVRIAMLLVLGTHAALAQSSGDVADHEALRKLKADVVTAINTRNLASMDALLHKPFLATAITQESFNEAGKLRAWFEGLFNRPLLRLSGLHMEAEADEPAGIYNGTIAIARGSTKERYELADGRGFDIQGRWTATAIKENGRWSILAIHDGTNFLENPVINAIERNAMYFAFAGAVAGVVVALPMGFLFGRRRARKA